MFSKRMSHRVFTVLILALCLTPMAAQARGRWDYRGEARAVSSPAQEQEGVFTILWRGLIGLFEKEGASIDPSGTPGTGSGAGGSGTVEEGASIDPFGRPGGG